MITDRNGEILAVSLPTAGLYANPREMVDPADAAHRIKQVLPQLDETEVLQRLTAASNSSISRGRSRRASSSRSTASAFPAMYFATDRAAPLSAGPGRRPGAGRRRCRRERRRRRGEGFDKRMRERQSPLRLSLDIRVQAVVREELATPRTSSSAIGACGIVMDVRTGEVLAMVSLPDYDANEFGNATGGRAVQSCGHRHVRAGQHVQAADGVDGARFRHVDIWSEFDAARHPYRALHDHAISKASTAGSICRRYSRIRRTWARRTSP